MLRKVSCTIQSHISSSTQHSATPAAPAKTSEDDAPEKADEDPKGLALLADPQPLETAYTKYMKPLERMAASRIETWLLSFDLALARSELASYYSRSALNVL